MNLPHVVVIGGGFGGLHAARALAKAPCRLTLVDRRNHHVFQPLLYQVATAVLNPSDIARPIRAILRHQRNATVLLSEVRAIDRMARRIELEDGTKLDYDYLIVAAGASHSYFGNDAWARFAPGLKSIEDALEIRKRVLLAYEAAEREESPEKKRALLTFVVVGGGPTGVELAGAL
jgi:NADH:ubiquinone reductase (H+-translocating)